MNIRKLLEFCREIYYNWGFCKTQISFAKAPIKIILNFTFTFATIPIFCYHTFMRTKAVIHLDRFTRNFHAVKARVGGRRICVPVKADAYGHGAVEISKAAVKAGADCLGVATVAEGVELRESGIKAPILLFSQAEPQDIPAIIEMKLIPFVSDTWFAGALNDCAAAVNRVLSVHLKIDTGMGRLGCAPEDAPSLAQYIADCSNLELAGTATHFAVADSAQAQDIAYTEMQLARFKEAVGAIRNAGVEPGILHAANSGAVTLHPETWLDMVRPGILLYGCKLAEEAYVPGLTLAPLKVEPVMELRSTVVMIKKIKKGESVSYGRIWTAPCDTNIGILPVGYDDGLPVLASGKWQAAISGKSYPLAGRICMDQCCVDLGTETNVRRWDEAVIFGGGTCGDTSLSTAELARRIGTIPYEIMCSINKRVPREYTGL